MEAGGEAAHSQQAVAHHRHRFPSNCGQCRLPAGCLMARKTVEAPIPHTVANTICGWCMDGRHLACRPVAHVAMNNTTYHCICTHEEENR